MSTFKLVSPYSSKRHVIFATTIGNALEFFDFTVYSFVGVLMSRLFFPDASAGGQMLLVAATFGVGFVMRPVGGLVIGFYSDRKGRKAGLLLTIALMALGSLLIGVAPTYQQAGPLSPVIIVVARLLQGFSAGGEVGASSTLMIESAAPSERGYYSSWQFASSSLGVLLGALVTAALTTALSQESFESWGWRTPFLLGALIAPVGWYIRRSTEETLQFHNNARVTPHDEEAHAWTEVTHSAKASTSTSRWRAALSGVLLVGGGITTSYTVTFFIPTYAIRQLGLPPSSGLMAAVVCGCVGFLSAPFVGMASDKVGRKPLILWARALSIFAIFPCFVWLNAQPSNARLLAVLIVLGVLLSMQMTPIITMVSEMYPRANRVTGMSVVYGLGVSVFGGFAQFINTWLVQLTGSRMAPAWYLSVVLVVSSIALIGFRDRTRDVI
ncbi:MFS transporter [Burkholderia cenocepacia]|uniref:MFS transporter n=1 Tax=Burkholderia cenocepacia TaxID=95486 RepID=UPI001904087E|nr:MFS transporter [Burkholderia cenocepacia]MBJ9698552.1 MFS transporter [Burkholderia cenocepacia]